jgi:CRP/FNR family cyclic AMP-dependent transcriptional regulator
MTQHFPVSITALRTLPIFDSLSDDRLAPVARAASLRSVPRGAVVLRAGAHTDVHNDSVYIILVGSLKVMISDEYGREAILSVLGAGELFGEMGVIDDHPRSASVVAVESSELVVISKNDFKRCLAENFDVSLYIMRSLSRRLRRADRNIESLALMDVYGRVARTLLDMAETENGQSVVKRKITKQDIAKMIGASREMVSRVMRDLQDRGLITEVAGVIQLHNLSVINS